MSLCLTVANVGGKGLVLFIRYLRWVFRDVLLESGQFLAVLVIEPLHLEVQVHIICAFTQAVFLMLWISKRKKEWEVLLHQSVSIFTHKKHSWHPPVPTAHIETYLPWRISYLGQTYSTWPQRWSCPRLVPGETYKRRYSGLNPAPVMALYYLTR